MRSNQRTWMNLSSAAGTMVVLGVAGLLATHTATATPLGEFAPRSAGPVAYETVGEGIQLTFNAWGSLAPPVLTRATVVADQDATTSPFRGNWIAAGRQTVNFQVTNVDNAVPAVSQLILRGASGRTWSRSFGVAPGGPQDVTVGLNFADGWTRLASGTEAQWLADVADVTWIGIEIHRGGNAKQSYRIANFTLDGTGGRTGSADLSPLAQALRDRFGVDRLEDLSAADRAADSLGDGMSDWERILAEHDDDFANAIFIVQIVSVNANGATIRWPAVVDSAYTVFRSDNIAGGFNLLPDGLGANIAAPEITGMVEFTDTSARPGVAYFYRVMRNQGAE